jgi:hypothetical protein
MEILKEIKKEDIVKKVMSEIGKAKKEILATMDVDEELGFFLPTKYYFLLRRKYEQGVRIKRIIFGSVKQYKYFIKEVKKKELFFIGKHTKSKNYKRMIMIDETKLFFRKKIKGKEKFYFTADTKYIKDYKNYFNKFKY